MRLFGLLSATALFLLGAGPILASSYDSVLVRPNQSQTNVATGALICATPNVSGVESTLSLTFPTAIALSSGPAAWSISTTNLPSGSTPWPGISYSSVASQQVNFSSSDLSPATQYCFHLSGTPLTLNQRGVDLNGLLATNLGSSLFALSTQDTQIQVTAAVPANTTDLSTTLTSSVSAGVLSQDQLLDFNLSYTNNAATPLDLTLTASWTLGTVSGDLSPSVPLVTYVLGSATNAYNASAPVIDTVNRTISWTISNYPAGETANVNFSLQTNSTYTGGNQVTFSVSSQATNSYIATTPSTLNFTYKYVSPPSSSSSSSSSSTTTSTSSSTTSSSSSSTQTVIDILQALEIRSITADSASLYLYMATQNNLLLDLGTSPNRLTRRFTYLKDTVDALLSISGLQPDTTYYFRLRSQDSRFISDYFSFRTAKAGDKPTIVTESLIVSSGGDNLLAPGRKVGSLENKVLMPPGLTFDVDFLVPTTKPLREVLILVRPKNTGTITPLTSSTTKILGAANSPQLPTIVAKAFEISPGRYTAKLKSLPKTGLYDVVAILSDFDNFRQEHFLYSLRIAQPIRVIDQLTQTPIEKAKLTVSYQNQNTKLFEEFSSHQSNRLGEFDEVLPNGNFKASLTALNYLPATVQFTIDSDTQDSYPVFKLQPLPFSVMGRLRFYLSESIDLLSSLTQNFRLLAQSNSLYIYLSEIALYFLLLLSSLSYLARMGLAPHQLPRVFLNHLSKRPPQRQLGFLVSAGKPLKQILLEGYDESGELIYSSRTTNLGSFPLPPQNTHHLFVVLPDLEPILANKPLPGEHYVIKLDDHQHLLVRRFLDLCLDLFGAFFEYFLLTSLLLQIFFLETFNFSAIWPSLLISGLNLIGWLIYHHHQISLRHVSQSR